MENNEQKQDENVVLEDKQKSKITFGKIFLMVFLVLLIILGVFLVLCGGTIILGVLFFGHNNTTGFYPFLQLFFIITIPILSIYLIYLVIKYGNCLIKYVKNK